MANEEAKPKPKQKAKRAYDMSGAEEIKAT